MIAWYGHEWQETKRRAVIKRQIWVRMNECWRVEPDD